jgi:hypothetical protein
LPRYRYAGDYHTWVIPIRNFTFRSTKGRSFAERKTAINLSIRAATPDDLPRVRAFWNEVGPRRQFFPCLETADCFGDGGSYKGLRISDLLLGFRYESLVGTLASWDQFAFRQTVVHGYRWPLRFVRPLYNCWARFRGVPVLPPPGEALRYLMAALFVVKDDDLEIAAALLRSSLANTAAQAGTSVPPPKYLLVGLHAEDPLAAAVRRFTSTRYTTRLYHVCWEDGEALRAALDGRVPYLELGTL